MPNRKSKKELITEAVLAQLPGTSYSTPEVIKQWWFTSSENLRLTAVGDSTFRQADIEFFDIPLKVTQQTYYAFIADCGRKLKCPYYIGVNKKEENVKEPFIRLYDSKIAMMVTLYGDIQGYLESIKVRR